MTDDLETFRDLAWRALEAPADAALRTEVTAVLEAHPAWTDEWRALRESHRLAHSALPAALARAQADRTGTIPPQRLAALLKPTVRHRRISPWWSAAALAVLATAAAWFFVFSASPDLSRWTDNAPASLTRALTAPLSEVMATATLPTFRDASAVQLRSPILAAQAGNVTIDWANAATTPLTLTLRENNRTVWTSPQITTRTNTPTLEPDHVYELVLTPATGPTVRERFVTVPATAETFTGFDSVLAPATAQPARLGEAVLAWHDLPEKLRRSETGRRLGIWLAVAARQPDLLAEVRGLPDHTGL